MTALPHCSPCGHSLARGTRRALASTCRWRARPLLTRPLQSAASSSHGAQIDPAPALAPVHAHLLAVPTACALDALAALLASHIKAGDCYCLFGSVGAGKSVFSRAFIRAVAEDDFLPVPSPTFLLQNTYDEHQGPPIHHFDFYRLTSVQDFNRLDLEGSLRTAVCLMEWPERLPALPGNYLAVHIEVVDKLPEQPAPLLEVSGNGASIILNSMVGGPHVVAHPTIARNSIATIIDSSYDSDSDSDTYRPGAASRCPEDVDTETEAEDFLDRRPRLVTLTPHGSYWEGKARRIVSYIAAHSHACDGLLVLQEAELSTAAAALAPASAASGSASSSSST